jgi:hypothetical protein
MRKFNFIEEYLRLTERAETPTSFLEAGAISCLSAVLGSRVYFSFPDRGIRIYPNEYILIIGDTSNVRKANPFNLNEMLLKGKKGVKCTKVISGQSTMQGVLRVLSETETGGPSGGAGYLIASEMSSFFIQDKLTIPMLTALYDYAEVFDKHLAVTSLPAIKDVCLSMFAGTNEVMVRDLLDVTAIQGGLIGRCLLVSEKERRHVDSGFEEGVIYTQETDWNDMFTFLKTLSTVEGPLEFENIFVQRRYNEYYHSFEKDFKKVYTKTGFEGRAGTHVLKLCSIYQAAMPDFKRKISMDSLDLAIGKTTELLAGYKQLLIGSGIDPLNRQLRLFVNSLYHAKNHEMTEIEVLCKHLGDISKPVIIELMKTLGPAGIVKEELLTNGVKYVLSQHYIDELQRRKFKGKEKDNDEKRPSEKGRGSASAGD